MVRPTGVKEARKINDLTCPTASMSVVENITLFHEKSNRDSPGEGTKENAARSGASDSAQQKNRHDNGCPFSSNSCLAMQAFRAARRIEADVKFQQIGDYFETVMRELVEQATMPRLTRRDLIATLEDHKATFPDVLDMIREGRI